MRVQDRVYDLEFDKPDKRNYPVCMSSTLFPPIHKPRNIEELLEFIMVNQGKTGSCVGQALVKLLSIIEYNQTGITYQFSPYWAWLNREEGHFTREFKKEGTRPGHQAKMITEEGVCLASQYMINPDEVYLYDDLDDEFYETIRPKFLFIASNHSPDKYAFPNTMEEVKQAITDNGAVAIGVPVYDSWNKIGDDGLISVPKDGEKIIGYHEMMIYGWDDYNEVWLGHNSWGKEWGDNGFFKMPYDYEIRQYITLIDETKLHWAHKFYYFLWENGIQLTDQRFEDDIKRGEVMAMMAMQMGYKKK